MPTTRGCIAPEGKGERHVNPYIPDQVVVDL